MRGNRDNCNTDNRDNDELVIELAMETIIIYEDGETDDGITIQIQFYGKI